MIFKFEKMQKKGKHMENQNFKTEKKGSKMNGEKRNVKKGRKWEKMTCPFASFFCIYFAFSICYVFFAFIFAKTKQNKKKKQIEKAK
jgi:cytochrome bd-type quinol oxidase subunit 1